MANQWYSIVEYAREFNISDMTIRRRIKTGKLNAVLKDGKYYIPVNKSEATKLKNSPSHAEDDVEFENDEQNYLENRQTHNVNSSKSQPLVSSSLQHSYKRPQNQNSAVEKYSQTASPQSNASQNFPIRNYSKDTHAPYSNTHSNYPSQSKEKNHSQLPAELLDSLSLYDKSLVDTQSLLQFCESSLQLMQKMELKLQEQFENKVSNLQLEIQNKNQEITQLQQQLEDLQVLVKILEKKLE